MPTGERQRARGFTYLWLLFLLAVGAAALGVAGERWSTRLQRDRELELVHRGREIAAAIASYRAAPGVAPPQWPRSFDELVDDRRGAVPRRHLRRVWTDPFTGHADWVPVPAEEEGGGWRGVRSRATATAWLRLDEQEQQDERSTLLVSDHLFVAPPPVPAASTASPGAEMPAPK